MRKTLCVVLVLVLYQASAAFLIKKLEKNQTPECHDTTTKCLPAILENINSEANDHILNSERAKEWNKIFKFNDSDDEDKMDDINNESGDVNDENASRTDDYEEEIKKNENENANKEDENGGDGSEEDYDYNVSEYDHVDSQNKVPSFFLFTRENPSTAEELIWNNSESILNSENYKSTEPTKMIIHGYLANYKKDKSWMEDIKDKLLDVLDLNVIIVDWSTNGANSGIYNRAAKNTKIVAPLIALQVIQLCKLKGSKLSQFHLIGHSLGAHVAGFTGKHLNGKIGQVTGLDPARPLFKGKPPTSKLWYTDAKFVDVIHTDLDSYTGFGITEPCGTVDFYPNGGKYQPGCTTGSFLFDTIKRAISYSCNHRRSVELYIEAIFENSNSKLTAHKCENYEAFKNGNCFDCDEEQNCIEFGLNSVNYDAYGENQIKFYFKTSNKNPFFL